MRAAPSLCCTSSPSTRRGAILVLRASWQPMRLTARWRSLEPPRAFSMNIPLRMGHIALSHPQARGSLSVCLAAYKLCSKLADTLGRKRSSQHAGRHAAHAWFLQGLHRCWPLLPPLLLDRAVWSGLHGKVTAETLPECTAGYQVWQGNIDAWAVSVPSVVSCFTTNKVEPTCRPHKLSSSCAEAPGVVQGYIPAVGAL